MKNKQGTDSATFWNAFDLLDVLPVRDLHLHHPYASPSQDSVDLKRESPSQCVGFHEAIYYMIDYSFPGWISMYFIWCSHPWALLILKRWWGERKRQVAHRLLLQDWTMKDFTVRRVHGAMSSGKKHIAAIYCNAAQIISDMDMLDYTDAWKLEYSRRLHLWQDASCTNWIFDWDSHNSSTEVLWQTRTVQSSEQEPSHVLTWSWSFSLWEVL